MPTTNLRDADVSGLRTARDEGRISLSKQTPAPSGPGKSGPGKSGPRPTIDSAEETMQESVRRYFARLLIGGGRGAGLIAGPWEQMSVDRFFMSMNQRIQIINPTRAKCSDGAETLGALFSGFAWD